MNEAEIDAIPIPPCTVCGETNDLHPVVWLRDGFRVTGDSASYHGQMECWVCCGRGPRGTGPTPDAAVRDALTRAQVEADRHRAWVAAGRRSGEALPAWCGWGEVKERRGARGGEP